ncbi:uncharacterized protein LOC120329484 [Styela clava]
MPAKAPMYLKAGGKNGAGNKGSKKLRELLSADMISPPLGDFRHTAHVGRGGSDDMFGDTSFLQKGNTSEVGSNFRRGGSLGKKEKKKSRSLSHEQSATLDRFKRSKSGNDKSTPSNGTSSRSDEPISPVLQSAFSLPILSNDETSPAKHNEDSKKVASHVNQQPMTNDENQKVYSKSHEDVCLSSETSTTDVATTKTTTTPHKTPNGVTGGPPKPRRIMSFKTEAENNTDGQKNLDVEPPTLNHAEKLSPLRRSSEVLSEMPDFAKKNTETQRSEDESWGFSLDLGPSLMDEIMGMFDEPK